MSGEPQATTGATASFGRLSPLHTCPRWLKAPGSFPFARLDPLGHLRGLMESAAVVGATSNPTIFQKAMGGRQRVRGAAARARS